jgi:hypothetical protein
MHMASEGLGAGGRVRGAGIAAVAGGLASTAYTLVRPGGVAEGAVPSAVEAVLGLVAAAGLGTAAVLVLPLVDDHLLSRWGAVVTAAGGAFGVVASAMALAGFALTGGPGALETAAYSLVMPVGAVMVGVGAFREGGLPRGLTLALVLGGVLGLWGTAGGRSAVGWAAVGLAWAALGTYLLLVSAGVRAARRAR